MQQSVIQILPQKLKECQSKEAIICYQQSALIEALLKIKTNLEQQLMEKEAKEQLNYEKQLQSLEADIREHIAIEQQMKLYTDQIQNQYQLKEKEDKTEIENLNQKIKESEANNIKCEKQCRLDKEISALVYQLQEYEKIIKKLQRQVKIEQEKNVLLTNKLSEQQNQQQQLKTPGNKIDATEKQFQSQQFQQQNSRNNLKQAYLSQNDQIKITDFTKEKESLFSKIYSANKIKIDKHQQIQLVNQNNQSQRNPDHSPFCSKKEDYQDKGLGLKSERLLQTHDINVTDRQQFNSNSQLSTNNSFRNKTQNLDQQTIQTKPLGNQHGYFQKQTIQATVIQASRSNSVDCSKKYYKSVKPKGYCPEQTLINQINLIPQQNNSFIQYQSANQKFFNKQIYNYYQYGKNQK